MKSRLSIIILSVFFSVGCLAQEGGLQQTVDEGVKKVESYYKGGMYHEAFEKLSKCTDSNLKNLLNKLKCFPYKNLIKGHFE